MQVAAWQQAQHGGGLVDAHDGFLVAVAVEPHLKGVWLELVRSDIALGHLAHDKLVEEQTVAAQALGVGAHGFGNQFGVFVAEGEYAAGLYADEGCVVGYLVFQQSHVAPGEVGCCVKTAFGDGGTATLYMSGDFDAVAEVCE